MPFQKVNAVALDHEALARNAVSAFVADASKSKRDDNIRVDHKWTDGVQRFSITIGDNLGKREKFDEFVAALEKPNAIPDGINLLPHDVSPKVALDYYNANILGKTFTFPGGETITMNAGHFFRLTCEGRQNKDGLRKGYVPGFASSVEALAAIAAGKVKPEDIYGWQSDRAGVMPLFGDLVEHPTFILEDADDSRKTQNIKRYDIGNGRSIVAIFRILDNGKRIISFSGFSPKFNRLKDYRVAYVDDAINTGTSPARLADGDAAQAVAYDTISPAPRQGGAFAHDALDAIRRSVRRARNPPMRAEDVALAFMAARRLGGKELKNEDADRILKSIGLASAAPAEYIARAQSLADRNREATRRMVENGEPGLVSHLAGSAHADSLVRALDAAITQTAAGSDPEIGKKLSEIIQSRETRDLMAAKGFTAAQMMAELPVDLAKAVFAVAEYAKTPEEAARLAEEKRKRDEERQRIADEAAALGLSVAEYLEQKAAEEAANATVREPTPEERAALDALFDRARFADEARAEEERRRKQQASPHPEQEAPSGLPEESDSQDGGDGLPEQGGSSSLPVESVRRIAPVFTSPSLFAQFIIEWASDKIVEQHPNIPNTAEMWRNPVAIRELKQTATHILRRLAKDTLGSPSLNYARNFAFDMYEMDERRGMRDEAARLRKVLDTQFAQFAIQPRVAEGGFWHKKVYTHQMWLDGLYMGCPFYARYASRFLEGEAKRAAFDDIANQFAVVTRHTYDAKTELYRHGWDESKSMVWADKTTGQSAHAWGRALGWFAAAIVDTEEYFPSDHPGREQLRKLMREYTATLIRWQDSSGAWWQVADQPGREGNYLESTATALIGYAMMKGVNRGILGEDAKAAAFKAWDALNRDFLKKNPDGTVSLTRCCSVAGLSADRDGSFEYYLREKIVDNDPKGVGPYMFLALEIEDAKIGKLDIQSEIDRLAAAGGGRVVVPAGEWTSGAIHLKSNIELNLAEGAKIGFTENLDDYLPAVRTSWEGIECMGFSPLIYAYGCTNVAITGKGTLAPSVETRWRAWGLARKKNPAHDAAKKRLAEWAHDNTPVEERQYWKLEGSLMRPPLIQFNRCRGVKIEGVTIRQSPFWTIHLLCSDDVVVRGLDVFCDLKNSDGIDIESSRNVLVENCTFEQGDDAVVIKSGINHEGRRRSIPSEDIVVRNCVINDGHSMLSIGSELSGGIRNILMEDCRAEKTVDKIFFIKTNPERGGFVENVTMRRIQAKDVKYEAVSAITDYFWKPGSIPLDGILRATPVSNIVLEDISATSAKAVYSFRGYKTEPIRGLKLRNIKVGKVKNPSSADFVEDMSVVDTPSFR